MDLGACLLVCVLLQETLTFCWLHFLVARINHCAQPSIGGCSSPSTRHVWIVSLTPKITSPSPCSNASARSQKWHSTIYSQSLVPIIFPCGCPRALDYWRIGNNLFISPLVLQCHSYKTLFLGVLQYVPVGSSPNSRPSNRISACNTASPAEHSLIINFRFWFLHITHSRAEPSTSGVGVNTHRRLLSV